MNTASFISCTFRKSPENTTYKTDLIYITPNPSRGLVVSSAYSELSILRNPESTTYKTDLIYITPNPSRGLVVSSAYSELSILKNPESTTYKTDLIYDTPNPSPPQCSIFLFCHYNSVTLRFIFNMVAE